MAAGTAVSVRPVTAAMPCACSASAAWRGRSVSTRSSPSSTIGSSSTINVSPAASLGSPSGLRSRRRSSWVDLGRTVGGRLDALVRPRRTGLPAGRTHGLENRALLLGRQIAEGLDLFGCRSLSECCRDRYQARNQHDHSQQRARHGEVPESLHALLYPPRKSGNVVSAQFMRPGQVASHAILDGHWPSRVHVRVPKRGRYVTP